MADGTTTTTTTTVLAKWVTIPTQGGIPDYTFRTRLDGRDYNLRLAWNQREERWYLDINDDADNPLATGVKVIANWPLLRGYTNPLLPPGLLIAIDLTPDGSPPGFYDLEPGKRVELSYSPVTST